MDFAKIGSKSTYHRCIKELNHWSYLCYTPSHNPFKGSRIKMFVFGTSDGQAVDPSRTKIGTSNGQEVVPIIKQIQTLENNKNQNKRRVFKNSNFHDEENGDKSYRGIPKSDNLKTVKKKNYNEPL